MLAEVVLTNGPRKVTEAFESFLGQFKVHGDIVLDVRKLEPVSLGSSHYILQIRHFPSSLKTFANATCDEAPQRG